MGIAVSGAYALLPGAVESLMGRAGRFARPRGPATHRRGVLHEPMGSGEVSGGLPLSRPSLRAALMRALG
jgi:hypothetical protein